MKLFYTFILVLVVSATGLLAKDKVVLTAEEFNNMTAEEVIAFGQEHGDFKVLSGDGKAGVDIGKIKATIEKQKAENAALQEELQELEKEAVALKQQKNLLEDQKDKDVKRLDELNEQLCETNHNIFIKEELLKQQNLPEEPGVPVAEPVVEEPVVKEGSPLPVTVVQDLPPRNNYNINGPRQPENNLVVLSRDIVTVYERGRTTNIVSSGAPYSVTIVGDRPEQDGLVNGQEPVGNVLPTDISESESVSQEPEGPGNPESSDEYPVIVGAYASPNS